MNTPDKQLHQSFEIILAEVPNSLSSYVEFVRRVHGMNPRMNAHGVNTLAPLINNAYSLLVQALAKGHHHELASTFITTCEQNGYEIEVTAKAYVLAAQGEIDQAVELVQKYRHESDSDDTNRECYSNKVIADLYRFVGKADEAIAFEIRYRIVTAESLLSEIDEEREYVKSDPNDSCVLSNFAMVLSNSADPKHLCEGIEFANRALESEPDNFFAWLTLCDIHSKLGNTHETIRVLEAALRLKDNEPEYDEIHSDNCIELAELYSKTRNHTRAVKTFKTLLRHDPGNSEIQKILESFESCSDQSSN